MKGRVAAFGRINGRGVAALISDGRLQDFLVDASDPALAIGAIHRGVCDRPVKGQGGMFVQLAGGRRGYVRAAKGLKPGLPLLVQITGYAEPGKALPCTEKLLLKGRAVIVTPSGGGLNVSRAIRDPERREAALRAISTASAAASGFGIIARSAAAEADPEAIAAETEALVALASQILADPGREVELLLDGATARDVALREWPAPDLIAEDKSALDDHGVRELLDEILRPDVTLPGGGAAVIEETRALVAVDVNTGPDTSPAAGLKANIALARDLPRQLRCRGLGGQIVVDFAPMPRRDRRQLEQALAAAFRADSVETTLAGWTPLGLFELRRKRERLPVAAALGA